MRRSISRPSINLLIVVALALSAAVAVTTSAHADERQAARVAGPDRYSTAVAVSRASWPGGSDVVFLAAAGEFADALSIGAIAADLGPVLLADRDRLPPVTIEELRRLAPSDIVVVGGPRAISDGVMQAAARYGRTTGRIAGPDRFATSVEVARTFADTSDTVYVANGGSYQTAIVASMVAGKAGAPLLLVSASTLPTVVERYLAEVRPARVVAVGDEAAINTTVLNQIARYSPDVRRLAGPTHAATAATASSSDHRLSQHVLIATQAAFPDALTGSAYAVRTDSPLLFVQPDRVPVETACEIGRLGATRITILGGPAAVSDTVVQQLRAGTAVTGAACERLFVPMAGAPLHEGVYDASGARLYVANHQTNEVDVIDTASGTHLRSIWVGSDPVDIDISKDGRYLYVTHLGSHDVLVVDVATGAWVGPRIRLPRPAPGGDPNRAFTLAIDGKDRVLFTDTQFGSDAGGPIWSLTHAQWLAEHRKWQGSDEAFITPTSVATAFAPDEDGGATASRLVRSADRSVVGLVVSGYTSNTEPDTSECDKLPSEESVGGDPDVHTREDCLAEKAKESQSGGTGLLIWDAGLERFGMFARQWGESVSNVAFDAAGDWAVVHGDGETTFVVNVRDVFEERLALRGTITSSAGAEGMAVHRDAHGCLVAWRLVDEAAAEGEEGTADAGLEVLRIHEHDPNVGRCRDRYLPARDASGRPLVISLDDSMAPDTPRLNEVDLTRAQLVLGPGGNRLAAMTENGVQILTPPLP